MTKPLQPRERMQQSRGSFGISGAAFWLLLFWLPVVAVQAVWWPTAENWLSAGISVVGAVLGVAFYLSREALRRFPISTLMLLGFTAYYFILPPVATLLEWKPLTNNLVHPVLVFFNALICQVAFLATHSFYRRSRGLQHGKALLERKIFARFDSFRAPTDAQLFIMGAMGLWALAHQVFFVSAVPGGDVGAINKVVQALYPLVYLPYCVLIPWLFRQSWRKPSLPSLFALAGYTAALLLVSIGHNTRSALLIGAASIAVAYALGKYLRIGPRSTRTPVKSLLGIALVFGLLGPVTDLATSMVIVREMRGDASTAALIRETLTTYQNKDLISAHRARDSARGAEWDEYYVESVFMARLSNLKFPDNSLDLAQRLGDADRSYLRELEWQRTLSVLPRPLLSLIAPGVDKDSVGNASGGDLMLFAVTQNPYVLGGFRVGSLFGSGFGMFGWFYPLVIAALLVPVFVIADAQTRVILDDASGTTASLKFSPMSLTGLFAWLFFLTSAATGAEAISAFPSFLAREWIQTVLVYFIAIRMASALTKALTQVRQTGGFALVRANTISQRGVL